ncbi:MAG TPA: acetylornithine deacetylase/succinyl-diaminopimelate desuccinylase family protein [Bryobacteraceae bacterium]|nr:acetylornithine deacetylase/succinyl-diaminopimelate desuccinylase family protein [Bryobacteraceae bacterium]
MSHPQAVRVAEQAVLQRIDSMADEMVEFLRELIAIPTVNPPGENYTACAEHIGKRLAEFGYDVAYVPAEGCLEHTAKNPRVNVIGSMRDAPARPLLHFNGHFDVVPVGDGWTVPPFGGIVRDGKVYGRGATDQKAGIAASIYAIEAIRRAGVRLHGTVEQSGTVDEESGGLAGMAYLAEKGYVSRDRTDFVILTEPLNVDRVCLGHRGVYWFEVTTLGRIAHGSMPFLGVNAIDKMADFLAVVERELKPALNRRTTAMPVEPPEARHASINVNSISGGQPGGGTQTACVADRCEAILDRRFLLEEPIDEVRREIVGILDKLARRDPEFRYKLKELLTVLPIQTDAASQLVTTMAAAVRDIRGVDPPLIASPGTYDQKHVMRLGLVEQCIAYGPGILHLSHQPDEYCRVDHLVDGAKAMALTAMRLLGAE